MSPGQRDGGGGKNAAAIHNAGTGNRAPQIIVETERGLLPLIGRIWKPLAGVGGFLFLLLLWWGFQPIHGGQAVGICRTLAELQLRYPSSLSLTAVDGFHANLRLYFTHIDDFGEIRSEIFECQFNGDQTLSGALLNHEPLDKAKVDAFNRTVPGVVAARPNTVIPGTPSDNIMYLKP